MLRETLPDLRAFATIVQEGSFRGAAAKIGVSASAVSHSMRRLEGSLGIALLHRTTRSISVTEAGSALMLRLRPALDEIELGLRDLGTRRDRISGIVRINLHRNAADLLVIPHLRKVQEAYPDIVVELSIDDGLSDIVSAGCDFGIRTGERLAKDMIAVRLSDDYRTAVVAAPDYLAERGIPTEPKDIFDHHCIGYRFTSSHMLVPWRFARGEVAQTVATVPAMVVDDTSSAVGAAMAGLGFAYVIRASVAENIKRGHLVEVLKDWSVTVAGDFLYYPSRKTLSSEARCVIDSLRTLRMPPKILTSL